MPGCWKLGFMPSDLYIPGPLGVISKSGSLSYEACWRLTRVGIGQSTVMGIGGDPIKGTGVLDALRLFDSDRDTAAVLVLGEIGGFDEYQVLDHALRDAAKPVGVFLVGRTAPRGRRLGHAGALIGSARETFDAKAEALRQAGVPLAETLEDVIPMVRRLLDRTACNDGG
jgi:succinyl-CoA synthetase alpha subunit